MRRTAAREIDAVGDGLRSRSIDAVHLNTKFAISHPIVGISLIICSLRFLIGSDEP
jgi:hypothetical protein